MERCFTTETTKVSILTIIPSCSENTQDEFYCLELTELFDCIILNWNLVLYVWHIRFNQNSFLIYVWTSFSYSCQIIEIILNVFYSYTCTLILQNNSQTLRNQSALSPHETQWRWHPSYNNNSSQLYPLPHIYKFHAYKGKCNNICLQ